MRPLNYHHLLYFHAVAQEGSVARASARLGLKEPTVSAQVHALEKELGLKLIERNGRGIRVTSAGETVLRHASAIFAKGDEMLASLDGQAPAAPQLSAGISSSLPPALVACLLTPFFAATPRPRLTVIEGTAEALATQLASHSLSFVLTDERPAAIAGIHAHTLLISAIEIFAPAKLARRLSRNFPKSLAGAPFLLPAASGLRREAERWLATHKLKIEPLAELPHPELCAAAEAAILAPALLRQHLKSAHQLLPAGELKGSRWQLLLLTNGRRISDAALKELVAASRS